LEIEFGGHRVNLLYQKAILERDTNTLIIADLHLGKIEHFRSAGIGMPAKAGKHSFLTLIELIRQISPDRVIFLGDLFHSVKNISFESFSRFLGDFLHVHFILVSGNHDILSEADYRSLRMEVLEEYIIGNLWFTHEPSQHKENHLFNIAGHLHPGVRLEGKARQSLRLPCFYLTERSLVLPAFGYFTGYFIVKASSQSHIFAIADKDVFEVSF
jgi:DNA ligase-associated metallophosphoesterase